MLCTTIGVIYCKIKERMITCDRQKITVAETVATHFKLIFQNLPKRMKQKDKISAKIINHPAEIQTGHSQIQVRSNNN
jgi:hypothetical protein